METENKALWEQKTKHYGERATKYLWRQKKGTFMETEQHHNGDRITTSLWRQNNDSIMERE